MPGWIFRIEQVVTHGLLRPFFDVNFERTQDAPHGHICSPRTNVTMGILTLPYHSLLLSKI